MPPLRWAQVARSQRTLPLYVQRFYDHVRTLKARNTADSYVRYALQFHLWADRGGHTLASKTLVHDYLASLAETKVSRGTIDVAGAAARRYLDFLARQGMTVAPQVRAELPRARPEEVKFTPTEGQLAAYMQAADQALREPYAILIKVLAASGLRVSEACNLRDSEARVERDGWAKGWIILTARLTKNGLAREVPLLPWCKAPLVEFIQGPRLVLTGRTTSEWLFPSFHTRGKTPVTRQELARRMRIIANAADIPVTPHALRRYYVTSMMRRRVPEQMIMKVIGHTDAATFHRYYAPTAEDLVMGLQAGAGTSPPRPSAPSTGG